MTDSATPHEHTSIRSPADNAAGAAVAAAASEQPVEFSSRRRARRRARPFVPLDLTHSGATVPRFVAMQVLGALFPITGGVMLYGWRALGAIVVVVGSALLTAMVWRRVGQRGWRVRYEAVTWLGLLLALTLPAHLFARGDPVTGSANAAWPILLAAGVTLTTFVWLLGGTGSGRIHPVLIVHLLLFVLFADMLAPKLTLRREHAFRGDLVNAPAPPTGQRGAARLGENQQTEQFQPAWISSDPDGSPFDAIRADAVAQRLEVFTSGLEAPERRWISLESLVRDRLPPLEDLVVGGQPAPIGQGSAIAIIVGGLFLLYRGLIDYRVPLLVVATALVCFLVLPVPVVITDKERVWRWLAMRVSGVGAPLAITFANYELMASPLMFTAFFLATSSAVRPLARRARVIYAGLVGAAAAAFQLYVSVSIGPYLALLGVSLLTPTLDRMFRPRTLV